MKNLIIEPDDTCFGDPWGETRCPELDNNDKCKDIEYCLECKKLRIAEIIKTIKFSK